MKLEYFNITTKDNTTCYDTVAKHIAQTDFDIKLNGDKAIELDFVAELRVEFHDGKEKKDIWVCSHDVASLVEWLKDNHPEVHALVPPFRIDIFQELAEKMKSSSHLSYTAVGPDDELDHQFGCDPDEDDFIPKPESMEEAEGNVRKNGFFTELHCYPHTPGGFWNYYGLDFESLFNHILKED